MDEVLLRPLIYAVLVGCMFVPLERLFPDHEAALGDHRPRLRTDVLFASVGAVLTQTLLLLVVGTVLAAASRLRPTASSLPTALAVPLGLLIFELVGYAYHRAAHAVPLLWRLHAVHHSAPQMDWLASFRQHPLEIVLMTLIQNLPLVLLGIP
ncbi:MAG: sterol desaturase family protein, partial [Myxococcales bacterium]|nr:sterol desaturase family protein [Myxococcales bacterium]